MPYRRDSSSAYYVAVPTRTGRVKRSTGTTHKPTAVRLERMLVDLGPRGRRRWDLLDRTADGSLALGALLDAWDNNTLDALLASFADEDLATHIDRFLELHRKEGARGRPVGDDTIKHYKVVFRDTKKGLAPEGTPLLRSRFTRREL